MKMIHKGKPVITGILILALVLTSGCTLPGTNLAAGVIPESTEGKDLTMGEAADNVFSIQSGILICRPKKNGCAQ